MEAFFVQNPEEFWEKHRTITQDIVRQELKDLSLLEKQVPEILVIEDVCRILKKSKQTIYNWMEAGLLTGYYMNGSLFFAYSEIFAKLKSYPNKEEKKKQP